MHNNALSSVTHAATPRRRLLASAAVLVLLAGLAVLLHPARSNAARASAPLVSTGTTSLGKILVSAGGRTLYHVSAEPKNVVKCTGACAEDWPPLLVAPGTKPGALRSIVGRSHPRRDAGGCGRRRL